MGVKARIQERSHSNTKTLAGHSIAWHHLSQEDLHRVLKASLDGLDPSEVEERLREFGKNTLPAPEPPPCSRLFSTSSRVL